MRNIRNFTFLTTLIICTSCSGQAQKEISKEMISEPKLTSIGPPKIIKTQGSQNGDNVHCSLQDKAGNLWFGTTGEGVYKFDGKSFTQFTVKNGLNSNSVNHMLEDKDGRIWIGTAAGLVLFDGKTFAEIHIPLRRNMPPNKSRTEHSVFSMIQARDGVLWFATIDGVYSYNGKSFIPFIVNEGAGFLSSNNNMEYILEDRAGNIWFGGRANKGVFRYDGKFITNLKPNGDNFAWPVLQDKKGYIWFSNWSGAYRYNGKSFTSFTKNDGLASSNIVRIIEDKKGNLWFGCGTKDGGICRYDGKSFTCFTSDNGLFNNDVWSILEDRAGNLWVGTRNTGLFHYNGRTFTSLTAENEEVNRSLLKFGRQ
ncbi:MAG: two-component regulator propeller domain-containing protein [Pedobacter sp.]